MESLLITANVMTLKSLTLIEKLILTDIKRLSAMTGDCKKPDTRWAYDFGVGLATVSRSVKKLEDLELIKRDSVKCQGGTDRTISLNEDNLKAFLKKHRVGDYKDKKSPAAKAKKKAKEKREEQLSLVEQPEREGEPVLNSESEKPNFGFTSPLGIDMIESDIKNGHINEDFVSLVDQLRSMFGAKETYEFKEIKAALVALECPEMVVAESNKPTTVKESILAKLKVICDEHLSESILLQQDRHTIAQKLVDACSQLNIRGIENDEGILLPLGRLISQCDNPVSLLNVRLARWAISDFEGMRDWFIEPESAPEAFDQTEVIPDSDLFDQTPSDELEEVEIDQTAHEPPAAEEDDEDLDFFIEKWRTE